MASPTIARGAGRPGGGAGRIRPAGSRRAVRLGGIQACGLRRQPIQRRAPPRRRPCRSCGGSPSAPGSPWARWWCWTVAAWHADPRDRRGCGRRRAGPAGPGPARGPRGGRGGRGRCPRPAGPAVCRDPDGAQPDDLRPDAVPRDPPTRRAGADLGRARRPGGARGVCGAAGGAIRVPPGGPRRRRARHRGADPQPVDRRPARALPGWPGGADDRAGARPDAQRGRGAGPPPRPGVRHRGRGPRQPHRDRRGRAGDPGRGRPGQRAGAGPPLPDGHRRRRSGPGDPRPRRTDAGAVSLHGRRAVGAVPGPGPPGRGARRDPRRLPRRALGQHRVRRGGRRLPGARGRRRRPVPHRVPVPERREPPSEDEQFEAYAAVVKALGGRPVTIRTLDLGADKIAGYGHGVGPESNPALGLRSLRLSLRDPEIFRPQLRALLRAAALGDVRILFPLVSTLAELRAAPPRSTRSPTGCGPRGTPSPNEYRSASWSRYLPPP